MFYNVLYIEWNFIKVISKPGFVDWHVLLENWYEPYMSVFGHIFETWLLHGILELVDVRRRTFGGKCKLDLTELSQD